MPEPIDFSKFVDPPKDNSTSSPQNTSTPVDLSKFVDEPKQKETSFWNTTPNIKGTNPERGIAMGKSAFYGVLESVAELGLFGGKVVDTLVKPHPIGSLISENITQPFNKALQGDLDYFNKEQKGLSDKYGATSDVANIAGQMLPFAGGPIGKGLGAIGKLPNLMSGRLGSIAALGASGAAQGGLFGAIQYDPNNPEQVINSKQAAIGAGLGAVANTALGIMPVLKHFKRQDEIAEQAVNNMVRQISSKVANATPHNREKIIAQTVKTVRKNLDDKGNALWKPLMEKAGKQPVNKEDFNSIYDKVTNTLQYYKEGAIAQSKNKIVNVLKNKSPTFKDLKEARTVYREVKDKIAQQSGITGTVKKELNDIYNDMTLLMQKTVGGMGDDVASMLAKANSFSKEKADLLELGGKTFSTALKKDSTALNFVNQLMKGSGIKAKESLQPFTGASQDTMRAAMLKNIMDKSVTKKQYFDIETFINNVSKTPQLEATFGPYYKMVKGFHDIVKPAIQRGRLTPREQMSSGSVFIKATFGLLDKLGGKPSLKKQLIKHGYLKPGELKDYMGNYLTRQLINAGVILSSDNEEGPVLKLEDEDE